MSVLWFFRHGQAGTRERYDSLSTVGRMQARLLGEYFRREGVRFSAVCSGSMERQRATAEEVCAALGIREISIDAGWNEFDLARVYAGLAPQICGHDADFRRQYEDMQAAMAASRDDAAAPVHRRWNDCDKRVVRAWVEGRYRYEGESWPAFQARILDTFERLRERAGGDNIAVSTSATPIGICAAETFGIRDYRTFQFAAVLFNVSITTFRLRPGEVRLFTFNQTPHLTDAALRTFR